MNSWPILLVDDDENDVLFSQRAIVRAEIVNPVRFVTDGQEAVSYLSGSAQYASRVEFPLPGLIITDFKLPRRSGLDLLQWLRQQPGLRRLPVIVLSSTCNPEEIDQVYDAGGNAFLAKPSTLEGLIDLFKAIQQFWLTHNQSPTIGL